MVGAYTGRKIKIRGLYGPQDHRHLPAFHLRQLINGSHVAHLLGHVLHHFAPAILVGHHAAEEAHADLDSVPVADELADVAETVLQVMVGDVGGLDPHRLHLHVVLLLARLFFLLLLVVPVLAVIHDPADRRARFGRDFHQVEVGGLSHLHGLGGVDDTDLLAVRADQANLRHADGVVYSREGLLLSGDGLASGMLRDV